MTDFEDIYKTYFTDVFRYLRSLCSDELLAEEITAQTFFKALRSADKFRGSCDIRVWLFTIAKNTYFSYAGKQGKISHEPPDDGRDSGYTGCELSLKTRSAHWKYTEFFTGFPNLIRRYFHCEFSASSALAR